MLHKAGVRIVSPEKGADFYIVNTCTVTGKTDRTSRHAVRRVLKWNPDAGIIVTGCGVHRNACEFKNLPHVVAVVGNGDKSAIVDVLYSLLRSERFHRVTPLDSSVFQFLPISRFGAYTRAFIKVQEGCDEACSYCIIPSVRGPSRSAEVDSIIQQVRILVQNGFREIVLTGIHLGKYGLDLTPETDLIQLLEKIISTTAMQRIRLSSIEPTDIMGRLIEYIANNSRICRHLHIPLQSGSDQILERMNRSYTTTELMHLLSDIKAKNSDYCIGADFITAFPGETDTHFEETVEFIRSAPIDYLHVFTYSPRPGTPAEKFSGQIHPHIAKKRCHILRSLGMEKARNYREKFIGKAVPAIRLASVDRETKLPVALSDNYIRILIQGHAPPVGDIAAIKIVEFDGSHCYGMLQ